MTVEAASSNDVCRNNNNSGQFLGEWIGINIELDAHLYEHVYKQKRKEAEPLTFIFFTLQQPVPDD